MPEHPSTTVHESTHDRSWLARRTDRILHDPLAWVATGLTIILLFFLGAMRAAAAAPGDWVLPAVVLLGILGAVFILPAWALAYLETEAEE